VLVTPNGHAIAGSGARESAFSVSNPPRAAANSRVDYFF